ncbi:uncharacterized protein LOC135202978 [Macrobrachium nipponense]|uniref:uncharacterized protein LOC135202978 n=1 Tax=Macrobrachium nipponense TaxID=159736 RepID=UPI0030C8C8E2
MSHHLEEEDHDNDDIERELYQLGLSDVPPPPPPALRGAVPWPPPSARSLSAPAIQEDSLQDPSVPPHSPRPPPGGYRDPAQHGFGPAHLLLHHHHHQILQQHHQQPPPHHLHHHHHHLQHLHHHQPQHPPPQQQPQQQPQPQLQPPQHHHNPLVHLGGGHVSGQPAPLTQHNPLGAIGGATHSTAISHVGGVGVRMGLWAAERPPPPTHRSLTDLATGNPGHNLPHNPIRTTTPGISLYNGGLSTTALASTAGTVGGGGGGGAVGATGGGGGGGAIGGGEEEMMTWWEEEEEEPSHRSFK